MNDSQHYAQLERMYLNAPCNQYLRPLIKIQEAKAEIRIGVRPDLFHAAGAVHGSNYFKAMDDAAFFAANSLVRDVFVLTTDFHIYLLRPIHEGLMIAAAQVVNQSRTQIIADAVLRDEDGRQLGRGSGTFVKSKFALSEALGYGQPTNLI